jgi:tetratricopeptide (TPR) repeat protein
MVVNMFNDILFLQSRLFTAWTSRDPKGLACPGKKIRLSPISRIEANLFKNNVTEKGLQVSEKIADSLHNLANKSSLQGVDSFEIAEIWESLVQMLADYGQVDKALEYVKNYVLNDDKGTCLGRIAVSAAKSRHNHRAQEILEMIKYNFQKVEAQISISQLFFRQGLKKKSHELIQKTIKIVEHDVSDYFRSNYLGQIAGYYLEIGDHKKSRKFYKKAVQDALETRENIHINNLLFSLARIYCQELWMKKIIFFSAVC